jgi:hypothetical protein
MPVPDDLRLKRIDTELAKLQQNLMELRSRIWPDHRNRVHIGRTGVIEAEVR